MATLPVAAAGSDGVGSGKTGAGAAAGRPDSPGQQDRRRQQRLQSCCRRARPRGAVLAGAAAARQLRCWSGQWSGGGCCCCRCSHRLPCVNIIVSNRLYTCARRHTHRRMRPCPRPRLRCVGMRRKATRLTGLYEPRSMKIMKMGVHGTQKVSGTCTTGAKCWRKNVSVWHTNAIRGLRLLAGRTYCRGSVGAKTGRDADLRG